MEIIGIEDYNDERCIRCGEEATYGDNEGKDGSDRWFCDKHIPSDARIFN